MSGFTAENKAQLIAALCTDIEELALTGRALKCLQASGIKFVAHLLTYNSAELRAKIFLHAPKSQEEIYETFDGMHIKKWFNALITAQDVRQIVVSEELEAFLENQPDDLFKVIMSDDMYEEGSLDIAEREKRIAKIRNALPARLKKGLSGEFCAEVVLELEQAGTSLEDVPNAAKKIVIRKLDLDVLEPAVTQTRRSPSGRDPK